MRTYHALIIANAIIGAILTSAGSITALAGTLGRERPVSVTLAILGVLQLVVTTVVHSLSGPPTVTAQYGETVTTSTSQAASNVRPV